MLSPFLPSRRVAIPCALFFIAANLVSAQLPSLTLATVFPAGGRSGTEVELAVTGGSIEEIDQLYFSHPGITAKKKPEPNAFTVTIGGEVPVGTYDVRVASKFGVSNPRVFVVGDLPESVESKPNDKPETAAELSGDSLFNGVVAAAAFDFFKFNAKKGERLSVECMAAGIDSRLSPVLAILDPAGRELDASRLNGLLDFIAPADGIYGLRLNDLTFAGGPEYGYRLAIRSGPRVEFVFPSAGVRGTKSRFTLFGTHLPGSSQANISAAGGRALEKLEVEIDVPSAGETRVDGLCGAGSVMAEGFSFRFKGANGVANPQFIGFAEGPVALEQEPNNRPEQAQKLDLPCEVAGQFYPAADSDCFSFEAKKGDVYWVEIFSARLGLPTSPFLLIQREKADIQEAYGSDANLGGPRFNTVNGDPVLRFESKEDGLYRVTVRDLFGNARNDPRNGYRLVIRKEKPDFQLAALVEFPPSKPDDRGAAPRALILRGGGTSAVRVIAFRQDNFGGEIDLNVEGLPPGVTSLPSKIPAGKTEALLLLTAAESVQRSIGAMRIIGKAKAGSIDLAHDARGGTVTWNIADYNNDPVPVRLTRDFPLAVNAAETAPVSVDPLEVKQWEIAVGGKLEIPLKITRRDEFKEVLKLKAYGAPGIEAFKEFDADAAATATIDLAAVKIPPGTHTIYFSALTKGKFKGKDVTLTVYSAPIEIVVKAETK
ncbi:MAG: peptidase domain protein [Chthoniobacteraceae bacterium]|nr:peptidase domain protein [Chthoniobacteraceae bacterium]